MPRGGAASAQLGLGLSFALLLLLSACSGRPPTSVTGGDAVLCEQGEFSVTAPPGWVSRTSRSSVALTRELAYGGGYPTVNVRRLAAAEALAQDFDGARFKAPAGAGRYRYQRWRNARGRGYRLDILLQTSSGWLAVDASVWDEAQSLDRRFFDETFWPIVNSVVELRP